MVYRVPLYTNMRAQGYNARNFAGLKVGFWHWKAYPDPEFRLVLPAHGKDLP